jgi:hypothetical protein
MVTKKMFAIAWALAYLVVSARAQEGAGATSATIKDALVAVPNRPSASTTAETVQRGVFEIEYGTDMASGHQDINTLTKFGLTRDLEVRFENNPFQSDARIWGFGDSGAGFKYRAFTGHEGTKLPSLSVLYTYSSPTATHGLGAGLAAHSLQGLMSLNFGKHHFDFNEGVELLGRTGTSGHDHGYFTALSYSYPIASRWGWTGEVSGWSKMNAATPSSLTVLAAVTFNVSPRLVLDCGMSFTGYGNLPGAVLVGGESRTR